MGVVFLIFFARFLQTSGPKLLGLWIKNAMEDPHSPECHETVMKAIKILKALPFDLEKLSEFKLGKIIKQIATGKEGSQGMTLWVHRNWI